MRFQDIVVGDFYTVNRTPTSNQCTRESGGSFKHNLPEPGDLLECIAAVASTGYDYATRKNAPQHTMYQLWQNGSKTGVKYKFIQHSRITRSSNEAVIPREIEKQKLVARVSGLRKDIKDITHTLASKRLLLADSENRLENLKRFDSDEEALAHIIKSAMAQKPDKAALTKIIKDSGLRLS